MTYPRFMGIESTDFKASTPCRYVPQSPMCGARLGNIPKSEENMVSVISSEMHIVLGSRLGWNSLCKARGPTFLQIKGYGQVPSSLTTGEKY